MENIEKRVLGIEMRNQRVEVDKAWEVSWVRRSLIMIFTYSLVSLFMIMLGIERPWLNALIPVIGFFLSALSLSLFKKYWIKFIYQKRTKD